VISKTPKNLDDLEDKSAIENKFSTCWYMRWIELRRILTVFRREKLSESCSLVSFTTRLMSFCEPGLTVKLAVVQSSFDVTKPSN
jgi:hypothetical protein